MKPRCIGDLLAMVSEEDAALLDRDMLLTGNAYIELRGDVAKRLDPVSVGIREATE